MFENIKDPYHASLLHVFLVTFGLFRLDQQSSVEMDDTGRHAVLVSRRGAQQANDATTQMRAFKQDFALRDPRLLDPVREFPGDATVVMQTLWPNLMFSMSANPPSMQVISAIPIDAGHSRQVVDYFFADDLSDEQMREYVEFSDLVTREDVVLCESVQRGLRSGAIEHGQLMLSRERGIQHFQKLVYRWLST